MSTWYLSANVYAARRDADIVILDARRGDYYCMPNAGLGGHASAGAATISVASADLAIGLVEGRLVQGVPPDHDPIRLQPPAPASNDLKGLAAGPAKAADMADFIMTFLDMAPHYYGRGFNHLISSARGYRAETPSLNAAANVLKPVLTFHQLLPLAPFPGVCLYRSFFLLRHLRRRGLHAVWMFGVRTWPFEAHCWLQLGDTVLDDTVDHTAGYTPIMVI
ncbi:lasso peptide biosynthesis B2 protein [Phenylobacterium sp. Root700]|uniref:lasso peptide biosynthesis B2 protein n=1 Tax=Phenylobacterium sp. Root700 TaxID=1736591 RepID=UPI0006F5402E|nr:lasso peptide biosynthesis B2 protein [Phenylobacterium sp. Root700]KRB42555.1 hypothetical protein ASE02_21790 [Phenylobacterium sp. Root700]